MLPTLWHVGVLFCVSASLLVFLVAICGLLLTDCVSCYHCAKSFSSSFDVLHCKD